MNPVKALASFFYVGYLPLMPGTWGSLAGLLLAWFFNGSLAWQIVVFSFFGFLVCGSAEHAFHEKDPSHFVLDEAVGMMVSVFWIPKRLLVFIVAFILFRVLDILKPGPLRVVQASKTPSSIMWDDLLAGVFVNIFLQVALRLIATNRFQ